MQSKANALAVKLRNEYKLTPIKFRAVEDIVYTMTDFNSDYDYAESCIRRLLES